jgi:hypothetical protein
MQEKASTEKLDREKVQDYFYERLNDLSDSALRDLAFLLIGEKPGALFLGVRKSDVELFREFAKDFDLNIKVVEGEKRSLLDRILRRDTRFQKDNVYLAREEESMALLDESEGGFKGFSEKAVGEFLGYPEEAVEYYTGKPEEDPAGIEFQEKIAEMVEEGTISEEEKDSLDFISYLPRPEDENIREAIEEGQRRKKLFEEFCEKFELELSED